MYTIRKPSRKTLFLLVGLCLVTVCILLGPSLLASNKNTLDLGIENNFITQSSPTDLVNRDSDQDGVLDWEESLWGLDPNKKDSDGNGVDDKSEITQKKEALGVKSENDIKATSTVTEQFSREFFSTFSALRQSGNLTKQNIEKLSVQGINSLTSMTIQDAYTAEDLIISTSSNQVYRKSLTATSKGLAITKIGNEITLLSKAIGKPKSDKLVLELKNIEQIYLTLATRTIAVPVPSSVKNTHLMLANTYHALGVAIGGLSEIYTDPALSVIYFNEYRKNIDSLLTTSAIINKVK